MKFSSTDFFLLLVNVTQEFFSVSSTFSRRPRDKCSVIKTESRGTILFFFLSSVQQVMFRVF